MRHFGLASAQSRASSDRRLLAVFATLLLASALAFSACTKKAKGVDIQIPGQGKVTLPLNETLRIRIVSEPPSLDWHKATDTTSAEISENIMEGLVQFDFTGKEPGVAPALATQWESADNKTWKITLRTDAKWSDGVPFTPQHAIDGFKRLLDPKTATEYAYQLYVIKNGRAFSEGKVKDFAEVGAKVSGPNEITVELEQPLAYFPFILTHHSTWPVRLDVVDKYGDKWTEPGNIVTIGPFNLKAWEHDKQLLLERNEGYYGEKAKVKYVVALMVQEATTALNLFDAGKIDFMYPVPAQQLRQYKSHPGYRAQGNLTIQYYGINVTAPPMDNPKIRKAISHAINRQEIVDILAGGQVPMTSFVPPGMFGYEASIGLNFDPEKAKALLKEAGVTDPSKLKIFFRMNTQENHQLVAENVQAQLKKNLGVNMEINNEEWKVYLSTLKSNPPPMFRFGWQGDYPDPDNFLGLMTSWSENNRSRWKNPKFDELIKSAAGEKDREKRRQLYADAQKIMVEEEVPLIPLFSYVNHQLIAERVQNFPVNILDRRRLDKVSLK